MSTIANLLDQLADARECAFDWECKVQEAAAWEVARWDESKAEVERLEKEIKSKAKFVPVSQAHTLIGRLLQLVWTPGRAAWDGDALRELAGEFGIPENRLAECQTQGSGFWSIRKRGKK